MNHKPSMLDKHGAMTLVKHLVLILVILSGAAAIHQLAVLHTERILEQKQQESMRNRVKILTQAYIEQGDGEVGQYARAQWVERALCKIRRGIVAAKPVEREEFVYNAITLAVQGGDEFRGDQMIFIVGIFAELHFKKHQGENRTSYDRRVDTILLSAKNTAARYLTNTGVESQVLDSTAHQRRF